MLLWVALWRARFVWWGVLVLAWPFLKLFSLTPRQLGRVAGGVVCSTVQQAVILLHKLFSFLALELGVLDFALEKSCLKPSVLLLITT